MHLKSWPVASLVLVAAIGCSGTDTTLLQPSGTINAAKGGAGGGGGAGGPTTPPVTPPAPTPAPTPAPAPSGGAQIPPSPSTDGPAWFFAEIGGVAGPTTANIDFDALQNMSPGGISVGTTRFAAELVYNVSKKASLTITDIRFLGANPGDFSVPASDLAAALSTTLPGNKKAIEEIHVQFTPSASGDRTATMQVTSEAGIAQILLHGTGLPQRPILGPLGSLDFITESAPANFFLRNDGGESLIIKSITIGGPNASAFVSTVANNGFSNCFPGIPLAPKSFCALAVGLAPGAVAPANASLLISTNDPITPVSVIPLTLR
jgi:hypothetical protein